MTYSSFDSDLTGALFGDPETAALFSDAAQLRAMLRVEAALARVEGRLGVIPAAHAERIAEVAESLTIEPADLAPATARDGLPVPALVVALREAVGDEAAGSVHWGATSQDILDSALVLRLRDLLALFESRLAALTETLARQAEAHVGTVTAARTRRRQATPTTLGLKIAGWLVPLIRHRQRLAELRPRLLVVQLGGASGTLGALGDHGLAVMEGLADELELSAPLLPWHSQRDSLAELGGWLSLVSGSLGKFGADLVLLGQSEVGELRAGPGGGSSTIPQKVNPVGAETLIALARYNAGLLAGLHQALVHAQERDGAAWSLEWLSLPQMAAATAAALRHAQILAEGLEADSGRMRANVQASGGLLLAEAAAFALAAHMPKPRAEALVKAACAEASAAERPLLAVLREKSDAPVDWSALEDPAAQLAIVGRLIDRVLALAGRD